MKSAASSSHNSTRTKITQFIVKALIAITGLILLWAILTFINNGLGLAPSYLLPLVFILVICVGALLYKKNYRKLLDFLHRKFPTLTKEKLIKIIFVASIVIGVLARLSFILIGNHYNPDSDLSDTGFHWFFAQKIVNNVEPGVYDGGYGAFFPHLMTYSVTLAQFMRIFGTGYQAILISNLIFDLITTLALYFLLKAWRGKQAGQLGVIIWMLNPLEIIFCSVGVAIVVTNMVLALSLLLAYAVVKYLKTKSWLKLGVVSLLLGIVLSIGNAYRPIFTVILIALGLMIALRLIRDGRKFIGQACLSFALVICAFFGVNQLIQLEYQSLNQYYTPSGASVGWNFFVGANFDSWGRWSREDSTIFGSRLYLEENNEPSVNPDLAGVQSEFLQEGITRYKNMSLSQLISHFVHKTSVFFADSGDGIAWVFNEAFRVNSNHPLYLAVESCGTIFLFTCCCLAFLYFRRRMTHPERQWSPFLVFLSLAFCGVVAASMLVEVMQRYVMPLTVLFVVFVSCCLAEACYAKTTPEPKRDI